MTLGEAFLYYGIRLIIFAVAAGAGIALGMKWRKSKNAEVTNQE